MLNLTRTYVAPGAHLLSIEDAAISGEHPYRWAALTLMSMRHYSDADCPAPATPGVLFKISYDLTSTNLNKVIQATGRKGAWNGAELNAGVLVRAKVLGIVSSSPVPGPGYEVHLVMVGSALILELPKENFFTRQARRQGLLPKAT